VRPTDRIYRIGKAELLVLMPVTHIDAARLVCSDLPLPLSRVAGPDRVDIKVIEANGLRAAILLDRLREPRVDQWDDYELPLDSLTREKHTHD
jgi:GGDEF domain-containing protein